MGENADTLTEGELEKVLEDHTQEQRESLIAIDEALTIDSSNDELLLMKEELMASLKTAEHNLFLLKRARLFREVDAMSQVPEVPVSNSSTKENQTTDPALRLGSDERTGEQEQVPSFTVGSKCRFPHTDGLWYNGNVCMVDDSGAARVSFLFPTTENMQICRFYLQQRCRFGGNCRQSHGMELPLNALRSFISPQWENISVGTTVLACGTDEGLGLWRQAELESLDVHNQRAVVVFINDGKKADVGYDQLALSEHADLSDTSGSSLEEEEDDEEVTETGTEGHGVGLPLAGEPTGTTTFAKWEMHTRGVASKMMASMGFREGMGLGKSGQGRLAPIEVKIFPSKQSLGYVDQKQQRNAVDSSKEKKETTKKKTRGGRRKQQKKWAAAAFAAKAEQEQAPDVFGFINRQLAVQFDTKSRATLDNRENGSETNNRHDEEGERKARKEDRRSIIAHEDEMNEIRSKIGKLEEMAKRNRKEKVVYDGVTRRLQEARKALADAEAAHALATNAVHSSEKEKKWLKF